MNRMNPERIGKLTTALRSGEFQQGKSMLHNVHNDTYCCLGVACEVYRRETGDGEWEGSGRSPGAEANKYDRFLGADLCLPVKVAEWYGLIDPDVDGPPMGVNSISPKVRAMIISGETYDTPLANLNDDQGWTFEQIADVLEDNL